MIHVLYHANCYDGFGAAWAAWRALKNETVKYRPVNYGYPIPSFDIFDTVFILDFSWPRGKFADFLRWHKGQVVVLDHHKTAQVELAPFLVEDGCNIIFDLEKSGAVLTWEHFHPGEPVPLMLQYIQDRDLWKFALPWSREAAAWMRSWSFDFAVWERLERVFAVAEDDGQGEMLEDSTIVVEGAAILRFQSRQVEIMADNAVEIVLGGHKVHAANATCFFSEVGEELCKRYPDEPFAAYWLDRADGRRQWGLRSRGGFDCTTVAKQYGGGGHPGAAGFITATSWCGEP